MSSFECTTLHEAARRYLGWKIDSDIEGSWMFMGGDKLDWCSGFAVACALSSGNWLANSMVEHAQLRSVRKLTEEADRRGCWFPNVEADSIPEGAAEKLEESCGVLAIVKGFKHIGVVAFGEVTVPSRVSVIHGNSANNAVEKGNWHMTNLEGLVVIPKGGWYDG